MSLLEIGRFAGPRVAVAEQERHRTFYVRFSAAFR